jgi:hypothetical protein
MANCRSIPPGFFIKMKDETNFIQTKDEVNCILDSLAIINPYVLVGEIQSYDLMLNFNENHFSTPITSNDYIRREIEEKGFADYCYYKYNKLFKNKIATYKVLLSDTDYAIIQASIFIFKKIFHNENRKEMGLTKEISDVLNKYHGNYFLVTDIVEYFYDYHGGTGGVHDWKLIRLFVLDKKQNKIIFYNNSLHLDAAYHHDHYKTHLTLKGLRYIVRKFKKQIIKTNGIKS